MKCLKICLILLLHVSLRPGYSQIAMLADIRQDVVTEFGTYHPYPVTIQPVVPYYDVAADFGDVVNFSNFNFSENEKALLRQNKFVVQPGSLSEYRTGYAEIYDIYNESREAGIPIFVTTDAMLHTFHLCFDRILMTIEIQKFYTDLNALLAALFDETVEQYTVAADSAVHAALLRNINYLIVARSLLDDRFVSPVNGGKYIAELDLIRQHTGYAASPLFGYDEDYSQYIPRGHYTRNDTLTQYFLAMMWLGRATFVLEANPDEVRSQTLSAILMLQALENSTVGNEASHSVWERIYSPTVFLVGKTDDINIFQYLEIAEQIYIDFLIRHPDELGEVTLLDAFVKKAQQLPGPLITTETPKGFRLMGQRFVPDSWVLDELVMTKVALRSIPKGLDVMSVLGSECAIRLLKDMGEFAAFPSYTAKLDSLCTLFKTYPEEKWAQNLYWNWLYALMPLLAEKTAGFPVFMQNAAWMQKDLFAALASWAELRHDTILYAKQSSTDRGVYERSDLIQGYVEPNPYLFTRMASLAGFFISGLASRDLLLPGFDTILSEYKNLALALKTIAEKELTNRSLEPAEYELINNFGLIIEGIAAFDLDTAGPAPEDVEEMPVIADVHTDANTNTCLEEGVGYPFPIYVICRIEDQLVLARGAGYSHYEFTMPSSQRLTDEKWREMLKSTPAPALPEWTGAFHDTGVSLNNALPQKYLCENIGIQGITVALSADTIFANEKIFLTCQVKPVLINHPVVITATNVSDSISANALTDDAGIANVMLEDLQIGQYNITAKMTLPNSSKQLWYRTTFCVESATKTTLQHEADLPEIYELDQNYPNPFAPSRASGNAPNTSIRFRLPLPQTITLAIYNIRGERVRTLLNGYKMPGYYQIQWDGRNESGCMVSAGVYFYQLQVGQHLLTKKMVLMF
ncbi:DUF3160 domain-containing protein [candidate division KSB1 bacterium]|nr:DUF3160 domain-containing protein [candidate division KSB1 bacterium]